MSDLWVITETCEGCGSTEGNCVAAVRRGAIKCCPDCKHRRRPTDAEIWAAVANLDGVTQWCEYHEARSGKRHCRYGFILNHRDDCSIVPRLLIPLPDKETP